MDKYPMHLAEFFKQKCYNLYGCMGEICKEPSTRMSKPMRGLNLGIGVSLKFMKASTKEKFLKTTLLF